MECFKCSTFFKEGKELLQHLKITHKLNTKDAEYRCKYRACTAIFYNAYDFGWHFETHLARAKILGKHREEFNYKEPIDSQHLTPLDNHQNAAFLMPPQIFPDDFKIPPQIDCLLSNKTDESVSDLKALLASWGMLQLYEWFSAQQLFVDVLGIMELSQAKRLLLRNGFGEGIQAHFLYHWKIWRSIPLKTDNNQYQRTTSTINTVVPEYRSIKIDKKNESNDDGGESTLNKIFDWGGKVAKELLANQDKKLSEVERANLCDMIINYFLFHDIKLNVNTCRLLAEEITIAFPQEIESAYHKAANGRLITKYNYKQRFIKKGKNVNEKRSASPSCDRDNKKSRVYDTNDEEVQKAILKLNNDPSLTADEIKSLWLQTAQNRIDFIMNKATNSLAVYAKWKHYTEPLGYIYIDIDFTSMYGEMNDIFLNMDKFLGCFMYYLKDIGFKNEKCREMFKKYDENMNTSAKTTILFYVIHEILKPTSMKTSECIDGMRTKTKRNIEDSITAFFHHSESIDTWNEYANTKKHLCQPIITLIGEDVLKPRNIFVYFDGIKYIASSMPGAIDMCFKVFHVLNIKYPDDCRNIWTFIEMWFYKPLFVATNNGRNKIANVAIDNLIATLLRMI